nr:deoxynucleoside kinase-like [Procambarus clarkii]
MLRVAFVAAAKIVSNSYIKEVLRTSIRGRMSGAGVFPGDPCVTARLFEQTQVHKRFTRIDLPTYSLEMLEKGPKAKFTVCVEGNIGSGKSTLLEHFSKFDDVEVLQEPVEKWRDVRGCNLLDLMYKDPCRWAHTFQAYVQMTMLELHLQSTSSPVKLIERSLYSARYCFVENLYKSGKMSDAEHSVYCEWYNMITQHLSVDIDLIVYLRTNPKKLYRRIKDRARSEEQAIPLQYLEDLHNLHEEWLMEKKHPLPAPVLVLDANDNLAAMYKKFEEHTADILCQKLAGGGSVPRASDIISPASPIKAVN